MEETEKNYKDMSNDELLKTMNVLTKNHEIIKMEIAKLSELLTYIEKEWYESSTELNNRMGVKIE